MDIWKGRHFLCYWLHTMAFSIHTLCFHEDQLCSLPMINGLVYWDAVIYFCLFHTFIVDKNNKVKTTHFHQQKLKNILSKVTKYLLLNKRCRWKNYFIGTFSIIKYSFKSYVMSSLHLCCFHITIWIKFWWIFSY